MQHALDSTKRLHDIFLANYNNLMNFMEEINNNYTSVSAAVRSLAFLHLLNLEKFDFYFLSAATTFRDYSSNPCKMSVTPSYRRRFK